MSDREYMQGFLADTLYEKESPFKNLFNVTEQNIDGLTARKTSLQGEFDTLDGSFDSRKEIAGGLGSMLLPFLVGTVLGGGGSKGMGLGLMAAGGAGTSYYNNLAAKEKEKKTELLTELKLVDSELQGERGILRELAGKQAGFELDVARDYMSGKYPNTDPYTTLQRDEIAERRAGARAIEMLNPGVQGYLENQTGSEFGGPISTQQGRLVLDAADVDRKKGEAERRLMKFQEGQEEKEILGLVDIPGMTASPSSINKFREQYGGFTRALGALDRLTSSLKEEGGASFFDLPAQEQRIAANQIFAAVRKINETGENLTPGERENVTSFVTTVPQGPEGLLGYLKQRALGNDPRDTTELLKDVFKKELANQALKVGKYDPSARNYYSPETLSDLESVGAEFGDYGAVAKKTRDVGVDPIEPLAGTGGGKPTLEQFGGDPVKFKEEYKKWRLAGGN